MKLRKFALAYLSERKKLAVFKLICCQPTKIGNKEGVVSKQFANMCGKATEQTTWC